MARFKLLAAAALLAAHCGVEAGYVNLAVPAGWSGSSAGWSYNVKSSGTLLNEIVGETIRRNAALNVGGKSTPISSVIRLAPNAARVAAQFAYRHPAIMLGVGAYALYDYYKDAGFTTDGNTWKKVLDGVDSRCPPNPFVSPQQIIVRGPGDAYPGTNAAGNYVSPGKCAYFQVTPEFFGPGTATRYDWAGELDALTTPTATELPVTPEEFENTMANKPLPPGALMQLDTALPVLLPLINPTGGANPTSQTARIPQGQPQPVTVTEPGVNGGPATTTTKFVTPVVDVVPANTNQEPWRVDLQPKDITKADATPVPEYDPTTQPNPGTDPINNPDPNSSSTPKTDSGPGLCDQYPGILACQRSLCALDPNIPACKLTTQAAREFCESSPNAIGCAEFGSPPAGDVLPNIENPVQFAVDTGWGGNGSCPPARHLVVGGRDIELPFTMVCDFMTGIRPIFIALAFLTGGFIVLGRKAD